MASHMRCKWMKIGSLLLAIFQVQAVWVPGCHKVLNAAQDIQLTDTGCSPIPAARPTETQLKKEPRRNVLGKTSSAHDISESRRFFYHTDRPHHTLWVPRRDSQEEGFVTALPTQPTDVPGDNVMDTALPPILENIDLRRPERLQDDYTPTIGKTYPYLTRIGGSSYYATPDKSTVWIPGCHKVLRAAQDITLADTGCSSSLAYSTTFRSTPSHSPDKLHVAMVAFPGTGISRPRDNKANDIVPALPLFAESYRTEAPYSQLIDHNGVVIDNNGVTKPTNNARVDPASDSIVSGGERTIQIFGQRLKTLRVQ